MTPPATLVAEVKCIHICQSEQRPSCAASWIEVFEIAAEEKSIGLVYRVYPDREAFTPMFLARRSAPA
ncbi:MAG: hypothetical protein ACKV19_22105 [Verrucomicrobiales bacterium]